MKLITSILLCLLAHPNVRHVRAEPNTNGIMCKYIKKLKRMDWVYKMDEPDLPAQLEDGAVKIVKAIQKAQNGYVLSSMYNVMLSIVASENYPGSLSEALSILASGYSRWVAKAFVALAETEGAPVFAINQAKAAVDKGIHLRDSDEYKASVREFVKAVRIILKKSALFDDTVLEKSDCASEEENEPDWKQIGQFLEGKGQGDLFGQVSISNDGRVLAVAASQPYPVNGPGYVLTFWYDDKLDIWKQMGQELIGKSVVMNHYGNIVAIREEDIGSGRNTIKTYRYNGDNFMWEPLGRPFRGVESTVLSLSGNGLVIAIAQLRTLQHSSTRVQTVQMFEWLNGRWKELGTFIDPRKFVTGGSLSASGRIFALRYTTPGNPFGDGGGATSFYELNESKSFPSWDRIGEDQGGRPHLDGSGLFAAMASVSVSSQYFPSQGSVTPLQYNGTDWEPRGETLRLESSGPYDGNSFGRSVAMSDDAQTLAIGDDTYARIFQYDISQGKWVQLGSDLDGKQGGEKFAMSLSLSGNGKVLAIGSEGDVVVDQGYVGYVTVYKLHE